MSELEQYKKNLQILKEQVALYGMNPPLELLNNIAFHETRIRELEDTSGYIHKNLMNKRTYSSRIIRRSLSDVVIIHDDLTLAEMLADIIKDEGLLVSITSTPQTALSLIERYQPRFVLVDVWYSRKDTFTQNMAEQFRILSPGVKIIGISPNRSTSEEKVVFDNVIEKPFSVDTLLQLLYL